MKQEPSSFTGAIFRAVLDSRSSFFAPKPHGNACYAGYYFHCLHSHHKPVNSCAIDQSVTPFPGLTEGLFTTKESAVRLFSSRLDSHIITSWFSIALDEIRT